jgi:4'-phosphopantetheinyl transferase
MPERKLHWESANGVSSLAPDEVHIWKASLTQPESIMRRCRQLLSPEELARAGRFYFEKDRNHFIAAHGMLRDVLSRYLGTEPQRIEFITVINGKPALAAPSAQCDFNLSHSGELALLAVTRGQTVGVDVERHRPDFAGQEIAERFFSREESGKLCALPEERRVEAFFKCWTRKEAYIKAIGEGLSIPLSTFDVAFAPDEPPALLRVAGHPEELERWRLYNLEPGEGYEGALLVEGRQHVLRCWAWEDVR